MRQTPVMKAVTLFIAALFTLGLSACSGGGSSDGAGDSFGAGGGGGGGTDVSTLRLGHFNSSGVFIDGVIGADDLTVDGGDSTNLKVAVADADGVPVIDQVGTVQFGSICAGQGLAQISPLSKEFSSGGAVVEYTALNCSGSDSVFAVTQLGGETVRATVDLTTTPCAGPCVGGDVGLPGGSVKVLTSSPQLLSSADSEAEAITVTALVRNASNVAVADIPVSLSASSGVLILDSSSVKTNASGIVEAKLHTGGDPSLRDITVFASVSGAGSDNTLVKVTGTTLSIDGPEGVILGQDVTYTLTLTDASGTGLSAVPVVINQDIDSGGPANVVTDSGGQVSLDLVVTAGANSRSLTASALGATVTKDVILAEAALAFIAPTPDPTVELELNNPATFQVELLDSVGAPIANCDFVISTTRGNFSGPISAVTVTSNASGQASAVLNGGNIAGLATIKATTVSNATDPQCPSTQVSVSRTIEIVATTPNSVTVSAEPATIAVQGTSAIQAVVRDLNNNPVKNQIVNFSIENYPSGSLSSASGTTGSDGIARVSFVAGASTSATNGVIIRALVGPGPIQNTAALTVGGQATRISLGFGNTLIEDTDTTYQLPVSVIVTDAGGNPASNAQVILSLRGVAYQKGHYVAGVDSWVPEYHVSPIAPSDPQQPFYGCLDEDRGFPIPPSGTPATNTAENDIIDGKTGGNVNADGTDEANPDDLGEDINDNNTLEPGTPATVPLTVTLDENGASEFFVTYPQGHGNWLQLRLRATATVSGTEGSSTAFIGTQITVPDASLDQAPPGTPRAICDLNGDGDDTDLGECNDPIDGPLPGTPVIGSPYGESSDCRIAN